MKKLLFLFFYFLLPNNAFPQNCQGDCINGDGTYTYATGAVYVGSWKSGKRSGYGKTTSSNGEEYVGNYSNDYRSGYGEYSFPSGEIYKGNWSNSKRSGYGTLLYQNGVTKYEGNFSDGKINGFGIKTYYNGAIYEGEWQDGTYFGSGKYYFVNGDIYEGEFENDRQHGIGKLIFANGDHYEGEFENGKLHGFGSYSYANGEIYIGQFDIDRPHGQGIFNYIDGTKYEGEWINGEISGKGLFTYADGRTYTPLPKDKDLIEVSSGSGFFINDKGYVVSSNHVVEICYKINTVINGITHEVNVISYDKINDLALLRIKIENNSFIDLSRTDAKLGESIMTAGFPWGDSQSNTVKVTKGNINALSGPSNNVSKMQFSAPVQPGNSGGPILNQYGKLIGVIQSMAKDQDIFEKTGQYPENVNFGTQLPPLRALLAANDVNKASNYMDYFLGWSIFQSPITNEALANIAEQSTIHLRCLNTIEGRKEIINKDKINYLF